MKVDLKQLKKISELDKVESAPATSAKEATEGEELAAIVRVREPGYVPENVTVRARMDDTMFTASIPRDALSTVAKDSKVQSVSLARAQSLVGSRPARPPRR